MFLKIYKPSNRCASSPGILLTCGAADSGSLNLRPRVMAGPAHKPRTWRGWEDLRPQCGPLYCRCFPLRACTEHLTSVSNWQSLPSPCSKRYWYGGQLYVWPNFKIIVPRTVVSHFYGPSKMCVYFCRAKKRCPYIFAQVFPSFCITSIFSEGQWNLFDRGTAEHLLKHSLFFFLPFKPQLLLPAEPSLNRTGFVLAEWGFPCAWAGEESTCNAEDLGSILGSIPGLGRSPGEVKYTHSSILA